MKITICPDPTSLGREAALEASEIIRNAINQYGTARIVLSTGESQFTTLEALVGMPGIDWTRVEMFHLDEYVDLPSTHSASFRRYLRERFVEKTQCGLVHYVDGTKENILELTELIRSKPVHLGLIGIGQNAHIAFNDPPADFDTDDAYIIVNLNDTCKKQQVYEGWFKTVDDVPKQAVSMSVKQIMKCQRIISAVPFDAKANAIKLTLTNHLTNTIPATILKTHPAFSLYADWNSFSGVSLSEIVPASDEKEFSCRVILG